jgi:hypothetical protein
MINLRSDESAQRIFQFLAEHLTIKQTSARYWASKLKDGGNVWRTSTPIVTVT